MKGTKKYRFAENPKEQEFHDEFVKEFTGYEHELAMIVIGHHSIHKGIPIRALTETEKTMCCNLIQWLGSPGGQGFLACCGFVEVNDKTGNDE